MSHYSVTGEEIFESEGSNSSNVVGNVSDSRGSLKNENSATQSYADKSGDGVDSDSLNAEQGFEYFKGKIYLDSNKHQVQVYSVADAVEKRVEAPRQRLARLHQELAEFADDLNKMSETHDNTEMSVWKVLQQEAQKLIVTANELAPAAASADLQYTVDGFDSLLQQQQQQQSTNASSNISINNSSSSSNVATSASDFLACERRVAALESMVGTWTGGSGSGDKNGNEIGGSMLEAIHKLEQKIQFLDGTSLESHRAKLAAYKQELESVTALKKTHTSSSNSNNTSEIKLIEAINKLDELHESVVKILRVESVLPALVLRLKTLEGIHLSAAQATLSLDRVEKTLATMEVDVGSNKQTLAALSEGLAQNMEEMKTTMKSFEDRLNAVIASRK